MKNSNYCEKITKMNEKFQNQKLRLFTKVDINTKLEILKDQKQLFHRLKAVYTDTENTVLTFSSLILAIDKFEKESSETQLKAINFKTKKIHKNNKSEKFFSYYGVIKELRVKEEMSFRDIAKYLKKHHKIEISYSLIYKKWIELEKNDQKDL